MNHLDVHREFISVLVEQNNNFTLEKFDIEVSKEINPVQDVGWLIKLETEKRGKRELIYKDKSEIFESYISDWSNQTWKIPTTIKDDYILLFMPGLFTGLYSSIVGYFSQNIKPFHDQGILSLIIEEAHTFSSIYDNAVKIKKKIENLLQKEQNKNKKIIFIGHSKGGVDCISTLSIYPELLDSIAGCICIQSPYAGCYFAKNLVHCKAIYGIEAMGDLNYEIRKNFLQQHPFHVKTCGFPVICVVSEMLRPSGFLSSNIKELLEFNINSDGLIIPDDAIIPDSTVVKLKNIDHAFPVFSRFRLSAHLTNDYNPASLTTSAFRLLLDEINEKQIEP